MSSIDSTLMIEEGIQVAKQMENNAFQLGGKILIDDLSEDDAVSHS